MARKKRMGKSVGSRKVSPVGHKQSAKWQIKRAQSEIDLKRKAKEQGKTVAQLIVESWE